MLSYLELMKIGTGLDSWFGKKKSIREGKTSMLLVDRTDTDA